jgi:hypothetical protein
MGRVLRPSPEPAGQAVVIAVVQRAQQRLPDADAPLLDRLFALECAARGGLAVAPTVERYRDALREAEWLLDDEWEPDVPHAAVAGQALSAAHALDRDPPAAWRDLLGEALTALERRRGARFGLGGDPALLAAVLRGLDAAGMTPPEWLLTCAAPLLDQRPSAEATAELAEALARHRNGRPLLANAVAAAFKADDWGDQDAPYARWWLASRREDIDGHLTSRAVADAQLQALAAADPADGKAAAMVMEAAARAAGALIIVTVTALSAERSRQEQRLRVSRAAYRGLLFAGLLTLGLVALHAVAHTVGTTIGLTDEHAMRQILSGLFGTGLGLCVSGTANACARAYGSEPPEWARQVEVLVTVAAGLAAALVS